MNQQLFTVANLENVMQMAVATGLFSSLATFSSPDAGQGPTGNPVGTFTPVVGFIAIACMDAPESNLRPSVDEAKTIPDTESARYRHVLLKQAYPALRDAAASGWRCSITDPNGNVLVYDLLGAEDDSQSTQTRCKLQRVTL